jgi:hypothetical protein
VFARAPDWTHEDRFEGRVDRPPAPVYRRWPPRVHARDNLEAIIDDSGSMSSSDPSNLRTRAMALLIDRPSRSSRDTTWRSSRLPFAASISADPWARRVCHI